MNKIIVTGGAGFIGSQMIKQLTQAYPNSQIVNIDNLSYCGDQSRLSGVGHSDFISVKASITQREEYEAHVIGADIIFHLAAESHVDRSLINPGIFFDVNATGTQVLLSLAIEHKVKRFVHVSTDEVYGPCLDGAYNENDKLNPTNPYSVSKTAAEYLALNAFCHDDLDVVITRGSNTYGPYQFPEKLIPLCISNILSSKKIPVYGDGKQVRDWLHVNDHAEAILHVSQNGVPGEIYNIPGHSSMSNIDLIHLMLKQLNAADDLIEYVIDRKGHDRRYALDGSKLLSLGWKHKSEFEPMFEETIHWYKDNMSWLESMQKRNKDFLATQYGRDGQTPLERI